MILIRKSVYILAVFLCVTFNDYAYSEIHRWTDESGKIFYSDKKPQSAIDTAKVEVPTANESAIRLDVPLVKQGKALCGPATIEMLFRYWGVDNYDQYDIAYNILLQFEDTKRVKQSKIFDTSPIDWRRYPGTGTANMREFLKRFAVVENPRLRSIPSDKYLASKEADNQFETLKRHISRGVPVIVHQYWGDVGSNGHYRIVSGYDDKKRQVYLNDSTRGMVVTQSYERFLELWNVNEPWLHFNAIVFNVNQTMIKPSLKLFDDVKTLH
tara:strand:+ start:1481 stop:2287 length:807 start_codon:yes stop_codon:yes gene_type:complete